MPHSFRSFSDHPNFAHSVCIFLFKSNLFSHIVYVIVYIVHHSRVDVSHTRRILAVHAADRYITRDAAGRSPETPGNDGRGRDWGSPTQDVPRGVDS